MVISSKMLFLFSVLIFSFSIRFYPQDIQMGGTCFGSNILASITEDLSSKQTDIDILSSVNLHYFSSDNTSIGIKFYLRHMGEYTNNSNSIQYEWIAGCYFQRRLTNLFFLEFNGGFGKDRFRGNTDTGFSGSHNIEILQFGTGINYYKFLSPNLILLPSIFYYHKIMFVKHIDDYTSNQHLNKIYFGIGFQYYFINSKDK